MIVKGFLAALARVGLKQDAAYRYQVMSHCPEEERGPRRHLRVLQVASRKRPKRFVAPRLG